MIILKYFNINFFLNFERENVNFAVKVLQEASSSNWWPFNFNLTLITYLNSVKLEYYIFFSHNLLLTCFKFLCLAKDVLNSNSILLLVLHRQEILCFVEDDLTTRPDMSGLSWGMLWGIRWDLLCYSLQEHLTLLTSEKRATSSSSWVVLGR